MTLIFLQVSLYYPRPNRKRPIVLIGNQFICFLDVAAEKLGVRKIMFS